MSALNRGRAAGDLTVADFTAILSRVREDRRHWELVPVTASVLTLAEEIIHQNRLRTLDAIHLAAALTFRSTSGVRVPFATADERQRAAAEAHALGGSAQHGSGPVLDGVTSGVRTVPGY
jgi:predicted nucleic acid-binding protein